MKAGRRGFLSMAARLFVLVLILTVFTQVGGTEVFGASKQPLTIDPLNPRIHPPNYDYQYKLVLRAVNASGGCQWSVSTNSITWAVLPDGRFQVLVDYVMIPITFDVSVRCGKETATSRVTYTWMN